MELVNIRYLKFSDKPEKLNNPKWKGYVPKYNEVKALQVLTIDDLLNVNLETKNKGLLTWYLENDFTLIPVSRRPPPDSSKPQLSGTEFPKRVLLELTSLCNLNCVMCPRSVLERPVLNMPKAQVFECIEELDKEGLQGLWLYNIGESMLHPDFSEILDYANAKKRLGSTWLSTNGQLLTEANLKKIISSKLTFINFSLNAMDADSYKKIASRGSYEDLRLNLDRLLKEKAYQRRMGQAPWLRIQMIDQPQIKQTDIDDFFELFGRQTEMVGINKLEAFSQDVAQNNNYAINRPRATTKRCNRIARGDCFIFADGEVGFCDTDFNHKMSLGNVSKYSIRDLWNGSVRKNVVNLNNSGKLNDLELCRNCLDYDL